MSTRTGLAALTAAALLVSCSGGGGPAPPRTGTPGYYWKNAMESYAKSDFSKSLDWIDKITKHSKNEYTARAWNYRLLLGSGLLRGYRELAENYEYGSKTNKSNPTPFIKKLGDYRGMASRMALQFGESYAEYEKSGPVAEAEIDFPFPPAGTATKPSQMNRIAEGFVPKPEDMAAVELAMLQRGLIQSVTEAMTGKDDAAGAREALKTLPAKIPRANVELVVAKAMLEGAKLYAPRLGANPAAREFLAKLASKALAVAKPEAKEAKRLQDEIAKELKESGKKG